MLGELGESVGEAGATFVGGREEECMDEAREVVPPREGGEVGQEGLGISLVRGHWDAARSALLIRTPHLWLVNPFETNPRSTG